MCWKAVRHDSLNYLRDCEGSLLDCQDCPRYCRGNADNLLLDCPGSSDHLRDYRGSADNLLDCRDSSDRSRDCQGSPQDFRGSSDRHRVNWGHSVRIRPAAEWIPQRRGGPEDELWLQSRAESCPMD